MPFRQTVTWSSAGRCTTIMTSANVSAGSSTEVAGTRATRRSPQPAGGQPPRRREGPTRRRPALGGYVDDDIAWRRRRSAHVAKRGAPAQAGEDIALRHPRGLPKQYFGSESDLITDSKTAGGGPSLFFGQDAGSRQRSETRHARQDARISVRGHRMPPVRNRRADGKPAAAAMGPKITK